VTDDDIVCVLICW